MREPTLTKKELVPALKSLRSLAEKRPFILWRLLDELKNEPVTVSNEALRGVTGSLLNLLTGTKSDAFIRFLNTHFKVRPQERLFDHPDYGRFSVQEPPEYASYRLAKEQLARGR